MRCLPIWLLAAAACGSSTITGNEPDGRAADARAADAPLSILDARVVDAPLILGDAGPPGCVDKLTTITLTPTGQAVTLDGSAPAPIAFSATGRFSDQHTAPIAATALSWSVSRADDTPAGTISAAGVFAPFADAGGVVTVKATDGCVTGSTTVSLTAAVIEGTPPAGWPGATVATGGAAPVIIYPSHETRFPRNVYRIVFQWTAASAAPFRITFTGPGGQLTVYTDGAHSQCAGKAAFCWEADERAWSFIAGSNAGKTVSVTVDALDTSGPSPVARRSAAITLGFSLRDVRGAIFYWSTTAKGIRRGSLAAGAPEDYLTGAPQTRYDDGHTVKCAACHVVSRDGKYLAAPVDASADKGLWILEVTAEPPPKPRQQDIAGTDGHGFATFSPDNSALVAAWKGKMWQLSRTTGAKLADLDLGGLSGTQPDWSPDNSQLVFATGSGDAPDKAGLALMAYQGGTSWGAPAVLVPAAGKTNLFPRFSPDGKWLAYSRGDKGSHDDLTMQLYLVAAHAGATPVALERASCVVSTRTDVCKTENYEPTWAPSGDLQWIAFNSRRAYGAVLPAGTTQLWVAAVDPTAGGDPSYPAFRIPFQGLAEDNHRAFWTQDIRETEPLPDAGPTPDAAPRACVPDFEVCDPSLDRCCGENYVCDTNDDGVTYNCLHVLIP